LLNGFYLDSRPEFVRASVISKSGELYASVNGDQVSRVTLKWSPCNHHYPARTLDKQPPTEHCGCGCFNQPASSNLWSPIGESWRSFPRLRAAIRLYLQVRI